MLDRPNVTYLRIRKRDRSPGGGGSGTPEPVDPAVDAEFNPDMVRAPKRLRRTSVRNASLPTAPVALCSRHAERLGPRRRCAELPAASRGCKLTVDS
jgi:hypothetical protein